MARYKHKYNEGDIVTDLEHNEVFEFSDRSDGSRAQSFPQQLRFATEEEKELLLKSGEKYISLVTDEEE